MYGQRYCTDRKHGHPPVFDETAGSNRDVVLTQNVMGILHRQGDTWGSAT